MFNLLVVQFLVVSAFRCLMTPMMVMMMMICVFRLKPIENNILLALNREYIELSDESVLTLRSADEIAVIPPLSGG